MVPLRYGSARSLHCATNAAVRGGRCHCRRAHLQRSRRHARYCTASQAPIHSSVGCLQHHPWCRCVRNCCSDLRPQRTHRVACQTSELRKIGGHTVCLTPSCPLLSRAAARSWPLPTLNKQHGAATRGPGAAPPSARLSHAAHEWDRQSTDGCCMVLFGASHGWDR